MKNMPREFTYGALPYPDSIDAMVLAAGVAETYTVPTGTAYIIFSGTTNFYVRYGATAAVPATEVTDGSGAELNPEMRAVGGLTTISLIAPADCVVTISRYGVAT